MDKPKIFPVSAGVTVLVIALMILSILLIQRGENRLFVQSLVGVTLVTGFGYGAVERVRGMRPALRPDEALLGSGATRLVDGLISIDGLLTLTSNRLIFSPLWPGPVVELPRGTVIRARVLGHNRLWVGSGSLEYTFEIPGAPEWAALLGNGLGPR